MNRITAIVIFLVLLLGLLFLGSKYRKLLRSKEQIEQNVKALEAEVVISKDNAGHWQAESLAAQGSIETLKVTHSEQLKKLEDEYKIKLKNAKGIVITVIETVYDTILDVQYLPDSSIVFRDSSDWHYVKGHIKKGKLDLRMNIRDSLSFVVSRVPHWFKPDELKVNAKSYNPNTKISGLEAILVDNSRKKRFGIGPMVGFDILSRRPVVGVAVNYNLIQF